MPKREFKPGNMVYPLPAALISCADKEGRTNLITAAWVGTACSEPPMLYVSIRKERFSHHMVLETGEFVLNLTTEKMIRGVDLCGVKSGRDTDKWALAGFTPDKSTHISVPGVAESPVSIECKVTQVLELGSHDMFLAEVVGVRVDEELFDEKDKFRLNDAGLVAYCHGAYRKMAGVIGTFGYSVKKDAKPKRRKK